MNEKNPKTEQDSQEQIIQLLNAGFSHSEIAKMLGCTKQNVNRYAKRLKIDYHTQEQISRLLDAGFSQSEIAKMLGCTRQNVNRYAKRLKKDYHTVQTGKIQEIDLQEAELSDLERDVLECWMNGKNYQEIADALGIKKEQIGNHIFCAKAKADGSWTTIKKTYKKKYAKTPKKFRQVADYRDADTSALTELERLILNARIAGKSYRDIFAEYQIKPNTAAYVVQKAMDAIDCERITPLTIERIMESYDRTKSVEAIAREHGCSLSSVARILSSNGIIVNERQAMILDLHGKGHSVKEIAQRAGCSESTVYRYLPDGMKKARKKIRKVIDYRDADMSALTELERLVLNARIAGKSYRDIFAEYQIKPNTAAYVVQKAMDAIDCERTVSPITVSPIVEDIMESYNRTKSVKAIAREHGCSWKKVAKILSSNGIIVNERQAMILDLHGKGHSVKEIAQRVGCSESTVRMYLPAVIPGYRLPGYKFSVAGDKPITLDRSISPN